MWLLVSLYSISGQDVFCNTKILVVGGCTGEMTLGAHHRTQLSPSANPAVAPLGKPLRKDKNIRQAGRRGNKKSEKQHKKHQGPKEELLCGRDFPSSPLRTRTRAGLYSLWATCAGAEEKWETEGVGKRKSFALTFAAVRWHCSKALCETLQSGKH